MEEEWTRKGKETNESDDPTRSKGMKDKGKSLEGVWKRKGQGKGN